MLIEDTFRYWLVWSRDKKNILIVPNKLNIILNDEIGKQTENKTLLSRK